MSQPESFSEPSNPAEAPEKVRAEPTWRDLWPPLSYWVKVAIVVVGVVIVVRILGILQNILLIVVAAFVISLGLQPAIRMMEQRGLRRGTAMVVIVLIALAIIVGAGLAIVPLIVDQAVNLVDRVPDLWADLQARSDVIGDLAQRFDFTLGADAGQQAVTVARALLVGLFNSITLLLLTPYFAVGFPSLKSGVFRLLKREHREDFVFVVNRAVDLTSNYIVGNLIVSLAAGVVSFIGFLLLGLPFPLALAAWVALSDLIPGFGALLGAIPAVVVGIQDSPTKVVWAVILLTAYQQFENYVIVPRVMRKAVNLNPALVIIALLIGGGLAGLLGALLALPVAALSKVLVTEFLVRNRIDSVWADEGQPPAGRLRRSRRGKVGSRPLP